MNHFLKTLFLLLSISIYANAASSEFIKKHNYEISYDKALEKAKKQNKPIMLILSTKTCPWCRKLERQTLKKDFIHTIVKKEFIPLSLDRDEGMFPDKFTSKVVPTVFFINPKNETAIASSYGYKNKRDFKEILLKVKKQYK